MLTWPTVKLRFISKGKFFSIVFLFRDKGLKETRLPLNHVGISALSNITVMFRSCSQMMRLANK